MDQMKLMNQLDWPAQTAKPDQTNHSLNISLKYGLSPNKSKKRACF
jgi:hypothetical protein